MTRKWHDVAPAKVSKKQALADLAYCITDPKEVEENYRVIKRGSRWFIQWSPTVPN